MNKEKVAQELLKVAKKLVAANLNWVDIIPGLGAPVVALGKVIKKYDKLGARDSASFDTIIHVLAGGIIRGDNPYELYEDYESANMVVMDDATKEITTAIKNIQKIFKKYADFIYENRIKSKIVMAIREEVG